MGRVRAPGMPGCGNGVHTRIDLCPVCSVSCFIQLLDKQAVRPQVLLVIIIIYKAVHPVTVRSSLPLTRQVPARGACA